MKQPKHYFSGSNENAWARGCSKCKYGIVSAPELTGSCELYLERLVQAMNGDITFCTCKAGDCYDIGLRNRRQALIEEARRRYPNHAARSTHPDIESARSAVAHSYAYVKAPPIRWVDKAEPQPQEVAT